VTKQLAWVWHHDQVVVQLTVEHTGTEQTTTLSVYPVTLDQGYEKATGVRVETVLDCRPIKYRKKRMLTHALAQVDRIEHGDLWGEVVELVYAVNE